MWRMLWLGAMTAALAAVLIGTIPVIALPRDGQIVVQTIRSLAAVSIDDLSLAQPTSQSLIADAAHVATTVTITPFTAGTGLVFALQSSFALQNLLLTGGMQNPSRTGGTTK